MKDRDISHHHQAGIIAYRPASVGIEVLLITSRDTGRFVIPKGNIGGKTSPRKAGAKEALEEAGVVGTFDSDLPLGFFTYQKRLSNGLIAPTTVEVFALRVERQRKKWPEKKERKQCWVTPTIAAQLVDEPSLKGLFLRFAQISIDPEQNVVSLVPANDEMAKKGSA